MFEFVKINDDKGIKNIDLIGLGQINVFCGKNNSGKTSVLQCLLHEENFQIGIGVESIADNLHRSFVNSQASRFTNPSPTAGSTWFRMYLDKLVEEKKIWFESESNEIQKEIILSFKQFPNLKNYGEKTYEFENLIKSIFSSKKEEISSYYISPKRQFASVVKLDLNKSNFSKLDGLINELFFLKNNPLESEEFLKYKNIVKEFNNITNCYLNVVPTGDNKLKLQFQVTGKWMDSENCGLGLKDVLFIVLMVHNNDHSVFLIEEPENHLHADFQLKLFNLFCRLESKQFIISTHSNVFLNSSRISKLFYCWYDGKVNVSDKTSQSKIIDSLGYSITENLTSDSIILTEGPTDIPIIKKCLELNGLLNDYNIKFWPLGGDIMGVLDLSIFKNVNNIFSIIDNYPGSGKIRKQFIANCKMNDIECFKLKRYSIENYIPLGAIKNAFPGQISKKITELKSDVSVDVQIGFKAKNKSIKGRNHIMANRITLENIRGSDLWDIVIEISSKIKNET